MAKATLPVNFKDDILEASMNSKRRYNLIHNSDGTVSLEDVTNYTQVGSAFGASQVNATNTAVNASADASKIIDNLDDIAANTKTGMMAGALAVAELNRNSIVSFKNNNDVTDELGYITLNNGLKVVWGSCKCNYANANVLLGTVTFPTQFSQAPVFLLGVGNVGNNAQELDRNAKASVTTKNITIAVHDPSSDFTSNTYYYVRFLVIGM